MAFKRKKIDGDKPTKPRLRERFRGRAVKTPTLVSTIPNIITIMAMCAGMTAICMAMLQRYDAAVIAILLAAILDAVDGRLARLLNSTSRIGAELDSLSDLLNFGVAPALVIYLKSLNEWGEMGWGVSLFYTTCVALRLARFNVQSQDDGPAWRRAYFTGVPSTAGGCLAMLPIMYENAAHTSINHCTWIFALTLIVVGVLMVSRLPILSMKNVKLTQRAALLIILVFVLALAVFYSYPWICLTIGGVGYLVLIPLSLKRFRIEAAQENPQE